MERMIVGELSKAKEKRVMRIKTKNYSDLPKVNDPNFVVLEKTVPGFTENVREKAFEE